MIMCVTISACSSLPGSENAETQSTQVPTAEPTIESTEKPDILIDLKKKEEIVPDVNMKVNGFSKETKITSGILFYKTNKDDNVFAIINITLNNTTDIKQSFNLGYFRLIDSDGTEYVPTLLSSKTDDYKFILINHFMDAGYKETGCLAFEVPKDTKIKNCKLCYNSDGKKTKTYFKLK